MVQIFFPDDNRKINTKDCYLSIILIIPVQENKEDNIIFQSTDSGHHSHGFLPCRSSYQRIKSLKSDRDCIRVR